jgi:DNA N-6-adenine-methyltransferase Dam
MGCGGHISDQLHVRREKTIMVKNYEKAKGQSSEWRTPKFIFDRLGLQFALDPCSPADGYHVVPARRTLTAHDDGLRQSWGEGLAFVNPPWSDRKRAVVPWLRKFFAHEDGGIFVCVARTSCDWWHELVLPHSELILFPTGKTRFVKPDGSPGPAPTNGIALISKGAAPCAALQRSGLGYCVTVNRSIRGA